MSEYVLITGTSRGIGKATEVELLRRGFKVISISRGDAFEFDKKSDIIYVKFNWVDFDALVNHLKTTIGEGRIVGMINNAGKLIRGMISEIDRASFLDHMEVNVWNHLALFRSLYREKLLSSDCHVVNIGSMGGVQGSKKFPSLFNYSASKAAFATLTEMLSEEYGGEGLSFNYLALGAVNTQMLKEAFPGYISQVNPENMAKYIVTFMTESGQFISGKIIQVTKSDPEG